MAITIKSERELELMRIAGQKLAQVHYELQRELKEGMTTKQIDKLGEEIIRSLGGTPNFLNYNGYPASVCVSINDEVVHGIPSDDRYLQNGDIVSLDTGLIYKGYHSDAARTHGIGTIPPEVQELLDVTKQSFFEGIKFAVPGNHIKDIGRGVQQYVEAHGFTVVRDLVGHGIGTHLHEEPDVPNYATKKRGPLLRPGMTLAVEPMVNMGEEDVWWLEDDWTVVTYDGYLSAHYENTIAITEEGCEILTLHPSEK